MEHEPELESTYPIKIGSYDTHPYLVGKVYRCRACGERWDTSDLPITSLCPARAPIPAASPEPQGEFPIPV